MRAFFKASLTTGVLALVGALGFAPTPAHAQAPAAAPGTFYYPGGYSGGTYFAPGYYRRPATVTAPAATYYGSYANTAPAYYRDPSTGRTNLPLARPWLQPLRNRLGTP